MISLEEKRSLLGFIKKGTGIKCILNTAFKILGNPITMFDTSYNLLTHTEDIITDDEFWNEFIINGTFSHESVNFFKEEGFIENVAKNDVVSILKSNKLKYDRINGKLFDSDNVHIGNINVLACLKPFDDEDPKFIEAICEILSIELQKSEFYQKIDHVYQESLIGALIEGKDKRGEFNAYKAAELYENLKTNLYVGVVDIIQDEHTLTHLAYYRDLFRKLQSEYKYYIYLNNIVFIISTDNAILKIKKDLMHLNEFFAKHEIYAGISSEFQSLFELNKYYREAINALNYGMKANKKQRIFIYDHFRVEHFLNSIKDNVDLRSICSKTVFLIREYDKKNNSMLLEVLYKYLLYGRDSQTVCNDMQINAEKLQSQLEELEDIFDIDWKNGNMILNIFLSLKMLKNLPKKNC